MIYVLEGMPPEWAKIYKFYSQKDPNDDVVWGIHFEQNFNEPISYIHSQLVQSPDFNKNYIGQVYNSLNFIDFSQYNLFYENLYHIPSDPTTDFANFQKDFKNALAEFLHVRDDTYALIQAEWEYNTHTPIQEFLKKAKPNCILSFRAVPPDRARALIYDAAITGNMYSHNIANPRQRSYCGTYVPYFSTRLDNYLRPIKDSYFDDLKGSIPVEIDKNGFIYFLQDHRLPKDGNIVMKGGTFSL